jgi:hypothetical protein
MNPTTQAQKMIKTTRKNQKWCYVPARLVSQNPSPLTATTEATFVDYLFNIAHYISNPPSS